MVRALEDVVVKATEMVPVEAGDTVVDIGANDGTLLSHYNWLDADGPHTIAFEPAKNLHDGLKKNCAEIIGTFFPDGAWSISNGLAKIITSVAMFNHVPDPGAFVAEIKRILHPEGVWVSQQAYLPAILELGAFDDFCCHEHLTFWGLLPFVSLLARNDLQILGVEINPVNGASLRTYVTHRDGKVPTTWESLSQVGRMVSDEKAAGLDHTNEPYTAMALRAELLKRKLRELLVRNSGKIDVYGASTKFNGLAQYCELGAPAIRRAVERSPDKVGRYTVTGIPIISEVEWRADPAPMTIIGIWAFKDAVIAREREYLDRGGIFVSPIPKPVAIWKRFGVIVEETL